MQIEIVGKLTIRKCNEDEDDEELFVVELVSIYTESSKIIEMYQRQKTKSDRNLNEGRSLQHLIVALDGLGRRLVAPTGKVRI